VEPKAPRKVQSVLFMCAQNAVRSPMVPVETETASRIDAAMKHAGLIN